MIWNIFWIKQAKISIHFSILFHLILQTMLFYNTKNMCVCVWILIKIELISTPVTLLSLSKSCLTTNHFGGYSPKAMALVAFLIWLRCWFEMNQDFFGLFMISSLNFSIFSAFLISISAFLKCLSVCSSCSTLPTCLSMDPILLAYFSSVSKPIANLSMNLSLFSLSIFFRVFSSSSSPIVRETPSFPALAVRPTLWI